MLIPTHYVCTYVRIYVGQVTTASSAAETDSNAQRQANVQLKRIQMHSVKQMCS